MLSKLGVVQRSLFRNWVLLVVIVVMLVLRLLVAGSDSYWFDELLSVELYGARHDSVWDAIQLLGAQSIHPPLYQFVLYHWIDWFGASELATRTLSSLSVALAIVFFHRLTLRLHGRAVADVAAVVVSLCFIVNVYGNEARSYALSLALAMASSYLMVRWLAWLEDNGWTWRPGLPAVLLLLVNAALLLTHYYNAFHWVGQGLLAIAVAHVGRRPREPLGSAVVLVNYAAQGAMFFAIWGPTALRTGSRFDGEAATAAGGLPLTPVGVLDSLGDQTFAWPVGTAVGLLVVLALATWWSVTARGRSSRSLMDRLRPVHALWMAIVPIVLAWASLSILGIREFTPRYFLYVVPHLVVPTVLAGRFVIERALPRLLPSLVPVRRMVMFAAAAVFTMLFVVPGTYAALADQTGEDWRELAHRIIADVEQHPTEATAVYQLAYDEPLLDHYLRRFSGGALTATGVLTVASESVAADRAPLAEEQLQSFQRLIVAYMHPGIEAFPSTVAALRQNFEVTRDVRLATGGYMLFDLPRQ